MEAWREKVLKRRNICVDAWSINVKEIERSDFVSGDNSKVSVISWVVYLNNFILIKMIYIGSGNTAKQKVMIKRFIKLINRKTLVGATNTKSFFGWYYTVKLFFFI